MELVTVKIRGTVITARYGTLTAGDLLRTDADYARHLVEDCNAATYAAKADEAKEPKAAPQAPTQAKARKQRG